MGKKLLVTACVLLIAGFAQAQQVENLSDSPPSDVLADDGAALPPDPMETSSVTYLVHTSPADLMDFDTDVGDAPSDLCIQGEGSESCADLNTDR